MTRRLKRFFLNGAVMTATALVMRGAGIWFGAYTARVAGAESVGLFSLVMSVYALAVTLGASGVNLAAMRLTAEALGSGDGMRTAMKKCAAYALTSGSAAGISLYAFSGLIASYWIKNADAALSLRILAFALPPLALSAALSGYFTAVRRAYKGAIAQVFEQSVKLVLTYFGLKTLLPYGIKYACAAIVAGACGAEVVACLFSLVLMLADLKKIPVKGKKERPGLWGRLLGITVPTAATAGVRSALTTLEHTLVPAGLVAFGLTRSAALSSYGVMSGMALPVILFPSCLMTSFASLLVPELAEAKALSDRAAIRRMIKKTLRVTFFFSFIVSALLFIFAGALGYGFYRSAEAGKYIRLLAPLIFVMYPDMAVDSMLKGLGEQLYSMKVNLLDAALSVTLVWLLVPRFGMGGWLCAIFLCELLNDILSMIKLLKKL